MSPRSWCPVLFVLFGIIGIKSQNCGFPLATVKVKPLVEDTPVGTIIEKLRIVNIEDQAGKSACSDDRPNKPFISWTGSKSDKQLKITLLANPETLIDDYKLQNCTVSIKLRCTDGRSKVLKLQFPLNDTNSKAPAFVKTFQEFYIELPWNCFVPLNFGAVHDIIEVKDLDRDLKNADIKLMQSANHDIFMFYFAGYSYLDENSTHTFPVQFVLSDCGSTVDKIIQHRDTTYIARLYVSNIEAPSKPQPWKTNRELIVQITFRLSEQALRNLYPAPYFEKHIYQFFPRLADWDKAERESTGVMFRAFQYTSIAMESITYSIDDEIGKLLFCINPHSGELHFKSKPTLDYVQNLKHHLGIYRVRASTWAIQSQKELSEISAAINLLVYFDIDDVIAPTEKSAQEIMLELTSSTSAISFSSDSTDDISQLTSTPSEPETFRCKASGWFVDTEYCNVFHVCEDTADGLVGRQVCCSSESLNFCEKTRSCANEACAFCTCSRNVYSGECIQYTTIQSAIDAAE